VTDGLVLALDAANTRSYVSGSTNLSNLTANANTGSLINGPTFDYTNQGSIILDGVDDYLVGSTPIINTSFSIEFCFTPTQLTNYSQIITVSNTSNWGNFVFHSTSGGGIFCGTSTDSRFSDSDPGCGAGAIIVNRVYYFCYTFLSSGANGTASIYKNSELIPSKSLVTPPNFLQPCQYWIGRQLDNPFGGSSVGNMKFHLIKIYNRVLSPTEVLQNYNATKSRFNLN
jgi:hypothetical protein